MIIDWLQLVVKFIVCAGIKYRLYYFQGLIPENNIYFRQIIDNLYRLNKLDYQLISLTFILYTFEFCRNSKFKSITAFNVLVTNFILIFFSQLRFKYYIKLKYNIVSRIILLPT